MKQYRKPGKKGYGKYIGYGVSSIPYLMKGLKFLKSIVNAEKKFHQATSSPTSSSTGSITQVSAIAQGDTASTRDGNSILAKYMTFRSRIVKHASATNTSVRIIIFVDLLNTGTTPTFADLLSDPSSIISNKLIGSSSRFWILKDVEECVYAEKPELTVVYRDWETS